MKVIAHLLGEDKTTEHALMRLLGRTLWDRLLVDLEDEASVTVPPGWVSWAGQIENPVQITEEDMVALMRPAGPHGGRLPR